MVKKTKFGPAKNLSMQHDGGLASGSMLVSINVVTLHWARLILGWVCGRVNPSWCISHLGQLSLSSFWGG